MRQETIKPKKIKGRPKMANEEKVQVEVKFKDLREAVVALNESGMLEKKLKLVGVSKEFILKSFMDTVAAIEDVDGKFPGPKTVLNFYNSVVEQEEATAKKEKAGTKGKDADKDADKASKTPKTPKEQKEPKEPKEKAPGVISTILDLVKKGPITKEQILAKLVKAFPDREGDRMKKTVAVQLGGDPCRMEREKDVKFTRGEGGTFSMK